MWRRSIRLRGFDYGRGGAFFVTVCVAPRHPLLGSVSDGEVRRTAAGDVVAQRLLELPAHYHDVEVDAWIVMPDHVHAVLLLGMWRGGGRNDARATEERARHASPLRNVVGSFKAAASRDVNSLRGTPGASLWQRGFYEHVVRDSTDLERVRSYISENPYRWRRFTTSP